jgi:hypothetical protein
MNVPSIRGRDCLETAIGQTKLKSEQLQAHRGRRAGLSRVDIIPTYGPLQDRLLSLIWRKDPNLEDVDLSQTFKHLPNGDNRIGHQRGRKQFGFALRGQIAIPWVDIAGLPFDLQRQRRLLQLQPVIGNRSTRRQRERLDDSIPQHAPWPLSSPPATSTLE